MDKLSSLGDIVKQSQNVIQCAQLSQMFWMVMSTGDGWISGAKI